MVFKGRAAQISRTRKPYSVGLSSGYRWSKFIQMGGGGGSREWRVMNTSRKVFAGMLLRGFSPAFTQRSSFCVCVLFRRGGEVIPRKTISLQTVTHVFAIHFEIYIAMMFHRLC